VDLRLTLGAHDGEEGVALLFTPFTRN